MKEEEEIRERWELACPEDKIKKPVIFQIGKMFKVVTYIFGCNIVPVPSSDGYVAKAEIEVAGTKKELIKAKEYLAGEGIRVKFEEVKK